MPDCKICGKHYKFITWSHLKSHNINKILYKERYPDAIFIDEHVMDNSNWSKGLTKETSSSVLKRSLTTSRVLKGCSNKYKGTTKETYEGAKKCSEALFGKKRPISVRKSISIGCKKKYENIKEREKTGDSIRNAYQNHPEYRIIHSEIMKSRLLHMGGNESLEHKNTKEKIKIQLQNIGYDVQLEKYITVNSNRYAIDILAKINNNIILIEVGGCSNKKIFNLQMFYPIILQIPIIK